MSTIAILVLVAIATYSAARRSLARGFAAVLVTGYLYGLFRANALDGYSHLLFDASLAGLYLARLFGPVSLAERLRLESLRTWMFVLIGWPVVLFMVPTQDVLVELVGLRGNVFMLPCLLLGARMTRDDLYELSWWVAGLNIAAGVVAGVQFVVGIEPFFPRNAVTELIYRSGDIANFTAYRLPSTFSSAHAYGGTMVLSLPILAGGWLDGRTTGPRAHAMVIAITLSVLGIFATGARLPVVELLIIATAMFLLSEIHVGHKIRWMGLMLVVAWIVSGEARFQRFLTVADAEFVTGRISGSVNMTFVELAAKYPLGNGLGGGGTSIPYFLQARIRNSVVMENEYARVLLEQGIPGVIAWTGFLLWLFTRRITRRSAWPEARLLMKVTNLTAFAFALLGVGIMTSIPSTAILMLTCGWIAAPDAAAVPSRVPRPAAAPALQYGRT